MKLERLVEAVKQVAKEYDQKARTKKKRPGKVIIDPEKDDIISQAR